MPYKDMGVVGYATTRDLAKTENKPPQSNYVATTITVILFKALHDLKCTGTHIHVHTHTSMYKYTHPHTHTHTHKHTHTNIHIHVHIYIIHACTRTHSALPRPYLRSLLFPANDPESKSRHLAYETHLQQSEGLHPLVPRQVVPRIVVGQLLEGHTARTR